MAIFARRRPHRTIATAFQDWAARMPDVLEMRQAGATLAEIGWKYGVSAGAVSTVLKDHGAPPEMIEFPKPEVIARICLCCQKPFKAKTRFLRLCGDCRN